MVLGEGILHAFQIERFGTDKVGFTFEPILNIWFLFIAVIGLYNFIRHDPSVIKALNQSSFFIVQQSLALGCFPRVKVVHTSSKYEGQIYVLEVNHILMLACVAVILGFKTTLKIENAYGLAVEIVMTLTSTFLILVMIMTWKTNFALIILYVATIFFVDLIFLSSVFDQFVQGGYHPVAFAAFLMSVIYGYKDVEKEPESFEDALVKGLKDFIREDFLKLRSFEDGRVTGTAAEIKEEASRINDDESATEVQLVHNECKKGGIKYIVGQSEVAASKASNLGKKLS
ncbi:potassium transporter 5-like [Macadamia integrifolia]|uniref:potassium transporter 5-like n=1 Tax=Macadamia integrifolia TaxID=60698 RepID=UPI001C4E7873|nr:potassium transporter 5-like [Macadamia integrifolia]